MAIDSRQRRKYQSGGYAANPYAMGTSAANLELERLKSQARQILAGGETTKKIEGMKEEFSARKTKAIDKQEIALEKAYEKAREEQKKAQAKAKKHSGLFKGLKLLGAFLGPIAGGALTGIATGAQSAQQKRALKGFGGNLEAISKHLKGQKIDLGQGWGRRVKGLGWLADPTKGVEKGIARGLKRGYQSMEEGAGEVREQAGKINPLESALMSGLTTFAMGKAMGKEGLFSKDAAFTPGTEAVEGTILDQSGQVIGTEVISEAVDPTKIGFGQRLKKQLIGEKGDDRMEEILQNLAMYQGILGDDFMIPGIQSTPQYYTE